MAITKFERWKTSEKNSDDLAKEADGIFDKPIYEDESPAIQLLHDKVHELTDLINTHITKIAANDAKTGITTQQANAITANTAKTGITTQQAKDISDNKTAVSDNRSEVKNLSGLITTNTNDIKSQGNSVNLLIVNKLEVTPDLNSSNNQRLVCGIVQNRGTYSLDFTFTDIDKTGKKIEKTGSIQLR